MRAGFALLLARRGRLAGELLGGDAERVAALEGDRAGVAADDLGERGIVAHRRGDDDLAALVVVGHHGGDVGNVAAVILHVEPAAADDPAGEADARGQEHVGELVDEQVGVHAAAEVPVTAPLGVLGPVERLIRGEAELGPQEHLPVDRLGGHLSQERVVPPLADVAVAVVAGLDLHDVADLARGHHVVGHLPDRLGGRLDADGEDLLGPGLGLGDPPGLVDGVAHRLLAIDVLAGVHRVDGHLGVPVVGRADHDGVDVLGGEDLAIVLGDQRAVVLQAAELGDGVEPAADDDPLAVDGNPDVLDFLAAVPDVADADDVDGLALPASCRN